MYAKQAALGAIDTEGLSDAANTFLTTAIASTFDGDKIN